MQNRFILVRRESSEGGPSSRLDLKGSGGDGNIKTEEIGQTRSVRIVLWNGGKDKIKKTGSHRTSAGLKLFPESSSNGSG